MFCRCIPSTQLNLNGEIMNKNIVSYRQGDVLIVFNKNSIQKNMELVLTEKNRVVLAYGEVTGHAHAIYEQTDLVKNWAIGKVKYLEIMETAKATSKMAEQIIGKNGKPINFGDQDRPGVVLKHEEHTFHVIPPGIGKLPVQVEYSPKELRVTRD